MKPIDLFDQKEQCCGCSACVQACSQNAIAMVEDGQGFVYPSIDRESCINCGRCISVCPLKKTTLKMPVEAYAAIGKDSLLVEKSASGGVFATLARAVTERKGFVSGAVMQEAQEELQIEHLVSDVEENIRQMQGSKYVQSDLTHCLGRIVTLIKAGKTVLFSGTPCQVQAVKNLTGDPENLLTIDLICHGVPSGRMLRDFLKLQGRRFGGRVTELSFRDKASPKPFTARLKLSRNGKEKVYRIRSGYLSYYRYFLEGKIYRDSCYQCPFATSSRSGDLTIGDYWGVEKHHPELFGSGQKAVSCVLINTAKGKQLLEQYGQDLGLYPTQLQWIAADNRQLTQPSKMPVQRSQLLACYEREGYPGVERQFIKENGGYLRFYHRLHKSLKHGQ